MTDSRVQASPIAPDDKGEEWEAEIQEAAEARRQRLEWLAKNPRPVPPRAMMQRSPGRHHHTQNRARSTTPTTPIATSGRS